MDYVRACLNTVIPMPSDAWRPTYSAYRKLEPNPSKFQPLSLEQIMSDTTQCTTSRGMRAQLSLYEDAWLDRCLTQMEEFSALKEAELKSLISNISNSSPLTPQMLEELQKNWMLEETLSPPSPSAEDTNVKSVAGTTPTERNAFFTLKKDAGLIDVLRNFNPGEQIFTWHSNMYNAKENGKGMRLDHFLVSKELMDNVEDIYVLQDDEFACHSDHLPVVMNINIDL